MNPFKPMLAAALCSAAVSTSAQVLTTDVAAIDLITGGTQVMTVDAGAALAGNFYFVVGTTSGTTPGFPFGGFPIPLNLSPYLNQTLALSVGQLSGTFAPLDAAGQGTAQFTLGAGVLPTSLAGTTIHHAYVVITGVGPITLGGASNAMPLTFVAGTPSLVITEYSNNPNFVFDSLGEWLELHNPGTSAVNIEGWTLSDLGSNAVTLDNGGAGMMVPAGGYVTLANNMDPLTNGNINHDWLYDSAFQLSNGADEIVLKDLTGTLVDEVLYDGGPLWPDLTGESVSLSVTALDATLNDDPANWSAATCTIAGGAGPMCNADTGTPGAANDTCSTMPCTAGGAGTGDLLIVEIMQNPFTAFDNEGEWFEVYNNTGSSIDMNGMTIIAGGSPNMEIIAGSTVIAPGQHALFARMSDMVLNGGLPTPTYDYDDGWNLSNGSQMVSIYDTDGITLICQVAYDNGATYPDPNGSSMTFNMDLTGATNADDANAANTGANWCVATSAYGTGTDLGTPGAANDTCP